ncbi:MAG: LysR family transcriptional regulator, partial [Myxococcales bacterium]|nr:LysR family transcriptional regulator [Myxococcales bacterium]
TQSAMSQTLARLRAQFDDPILVKTGRRMLPSPFAERIQPRLRRAVAELEAIVQDRPEFDPATAERRFVLATVDYLALVLFPALQGVVGAHAPGVDLAVHALDAGSIAARLESGVVHLYLGIQGPTERALTAEPLFEDGFRVVTRRDHPLARSRRGPSLAAYAAAPHLHVSPRREEGSLVGRALAAAGHDRRVAVEVPYFALVPALLASSDLVATVPTSLALHWKRAHALAVLPPPIDLPRLRLCMAWHPTFARDPALVWLRRTVAAVATKVST